MNPNGSRGKTLTFAPSPVPVPLPLPSYRGDRHGFDERRPQAAVQASQARVPDHIPDQPDARFLLGHLHPGLDHVRRIDDRPHEQPGHAAGRHRGHRVAVLFLRASRLQQFPGPFVRTCPCGATAVYRLSAQTYGGYVGKRKRAHVARVRIVHLDVHAGRGEGEQGGELPPGPEFLLGLGNLGLLNVFKLKK